ncbi:unnamed protein product [Brachionus calyciflorus]|uniref:Presenilin n=1 Tax=Brachionus calyciflorus TaxID=104777 RepID=A0A813M3U8_9BILA|nr:unnamed protein product [Brachionus calyciflorus]
MSDLLDNSVNEYDLLKASANNRNGNYRSTDQTNLSVNLNTENEVRIIEPRSSRKTRDQSSENAQASVELTNRRPSDNINDEDLDEIQDELVLKYGAQHVVKLFIPVTICLLFVIISLSAIKSYQKSDGAQLIYTPFNEDSQGSSGTKLWMSIANASIFIGVVVVMTVVLIVLYKFRFYRVIHGWLAFSSLMLLFLFTFMFITEFFKQFNIVIDMFTLFVLLWNFGVIGMIAIHWKGPLILQQIFLIFTCVQMALIFIKYLPEWTTWVLLAFISIWDLIAVLCPFGPLRILVETAKSRNDTLFPSMVYSSTLIYMMARKGETNQHVSNQNLTSDLNNQNGTDEEEADFNEIERVPSRILTGTNENVRQRHAGQTSNQRPAHANRETINELEHQTQEEEENGVKLGLGDFIFYSILVGKASILGDWNTVIACFVAILLGLCLTLVLLAVFHKPLPALPISLFFGLIFYFSTNLVVRPFYDNLAFRQVFI